MANVVFELENSSEMATWTDKWRYDAAEDNFYGQSTEVSYLVMKHVPFVQILSVFY